MKSNETPAQESVHISEWTLGMWLHESDSCSIVSDSLWPHGLYWNSPGQNTEWVAYPFSSRSSWPRNRTRVSCIAGGFFTNWAICYSQKFFVLPRGGSRENKHEELHERRRNKRREEKQNTLRLFSLRALPAGNWPIQTWTPPLGESLVTKAGYWQRRYKIEGTCEP